MLDTSLIARRLFKVKIALEEVLHLLCRQAQRCDALKQRTNNCLVANARLLIEKDVPNCVSYIMKDGDKPSMRLG